MDYCQKLQSDYQEDGLFNSRFEIFVASFGALAGSVFAPLASGAAKTAWSGLSGATNGVQTAFDQSFGALQMAKRRASIAKVVDNFASSHDSSAAGASPPSFTPIDASLLMGRCAVAAALADSDTLAAAATVAKATQSDFSCNASKADANGTSSISCSNQMSFTCSSKPDAAKSASMTYSSKTSSNKPKADGLVNAPAAAANGAK